MAIETLGDVRTIWHGAELQAKIKKALGKGLQAGAIFLKGRVKELISVPARKFKVVGTSRTGKAIVKKVFPKAKKGAPPRKVTGDLRRSITHEMSADKLTARVGTNLPYAPILEYQTNHPFLQPAYDHWKDTIAGIISRESVV